MRWLLAGASGFLGTALRVRLADEGQQVVRLVRREPASMNEFAWNPATGEVDRRALDGVDVVVNLAGVGIADRPWTSARRRALLRSRVDSTDTLARAVANTESQPVLIQASGIAYYGTERSEHPHTEDDSPAEDFLAQLVVSWEAATEPAHAAGGRVVIMRTSPVLDSSGGPFWIMKLAWSCGAGAVLGDGTQRMPMISLTDYLDFVGWAATHAEVAGPYNLTIPEPATNAEFTDILAELLHRPRLLRAPAPLIRLPLGELAEQLLGDMYVVPQRATEQGFTFRGADVRETVRLALAT